jgi:hypothetical protein
VTQPRIIYVHGAGPQEHRAIVKRRLDQALFGANQLDRTALAYYADIIYGEPEIPGPLEAGDPDAAEIEATFLARATAVAAADATEGGPDGGPAPIEGISLPDPAFLILASLASSDVIKYLIGDAGPRLRERVSDAIPDGEPLIVVAHSLGTIVTYDVLASRADLDVRLLVTVGCPLGINNVQRRIGDRTGPPASIPACVDTWLNFADALDPVALELTLADEFRPADFIVDAIVDNHALLNHDLVGYLETPEVRAAVATALAGDDPAAPDPDH